MTVGALVFDFDGLILDTESSAYLVARVAYQTRVPDRIEHSVYTPLVAAARAWDVDASGRVRGQRAAANSGTVSSRA